MRWGDRQLAMLREMGIRLWQAEPAVQAAPAGSDGVETLEAEREPEARSIASHLEAAVAHLAPRVIAPATGRGAAASAGALADGFPATWMIVGDGPGDADGQGGSASNAKAGQLLDNMLHACGLDRRAAATQPEKQVFITHAMTARASGGPASADEVASDEARLLGQLAKVQPKVVVAMGRVAAQTLLRSSEPLGKLRGRVHRAPGAPDTAVVVTYPATYLLRNPQDKARAWEDLCLAMSVVKAPAG